jgi:beta-glucosidase
MPQATIHFPAGFLWGTATAAHQVEGGNNNNNWSQWESTPGNILNGAKSGLACDWWGGRWKEDLDRAAECGQNAHRLSIEWSRVQPTPDRWDENALDYYRQILRGMRDRGIKPMVTLHHFTDPLWIAEQGGWENAQTPRLFNDYVRKTVTAIKEYANLWCTINEPNSCIWGGYLGAGFPPGVNSLPRAGNAMYHMLLGHALAYHTIHAAQPEAMAGIANNFRELVPAHPAFLPDRWVSSMISHIFNDSFLLAAQTGKFNLILKSFSVPEAKTTQDFIGVNYYTSELVTFDLRFPGTLFTKRAFPPGADISENRFIASVPSGLYNILKAQLRYKLPIYITENGVEDSHDALRPGYLIEHLWQTWRAVNFNWPIKGYFHWSLVDNFEWERGWTQRFGLWAVSYTHLTLPTIYSV